MGSEMCIRDSDIKRAINEIEMLGSQKYRCKALSESDPFVQKHVKF